MKNLRSLGAVALLSVAGSSQAAIATTDVVAAITDAATAAGVIGLAVLVLFVGIKGFKWVRRAL